MAFLLLMSHGKLHVKLTSLRKALCAVFTVEFAFNLGELHPLEHTS